MMCWHLRRLLNNVQQMPLNRAPLDHSVKAHRNVARYCRCLQNITIHELSLMADHINSLALFLSDHFTVMVNTWLQYVVLSCRSRRVWCVWNSAMSSQLAKNKMLQETTRRILLLPVVREQQLSRLHHREVVLERIAVSQQRVVIGFIIIIIVVTVIIAVCDSVIIAVCDQSKGWGHCVPHLLFSVRIVPNLNLTPRKISKTVAFGCQILRLQIPQGELTALPRSLSCI